jgi:hypothetical protein
VHKRTTSIAESCQILHRLEEQTYIEKESMHNLRASIRASRVVRLGVYVATTSEQVDLVNIADAASKPLQ